MPNNNQPEFQAILDIFKTFDDPKHPISASPNVRFYMFLDYLFGIDKTIDNESLELAIDALRHVYTDDFRHYYSDIFSIISGPADIKGEDRICHVEKVAGAFSQNISRLNEKIERLPNCKENCSLKKCFPKFFDHATLEIGRLEYNNTQIDQHLKEIKEIQESVAAAEKKVQSQSSKVDRQEKSVTEVRDDVSKTKEKLADSQREYITILGIFAAIVLVFNGAIGFSSSAIEAIVREGNFANLLFIVLIVGEILFNTVFILLTFIWKMSRQEKKTPDEVWKIFAVLNGIMLVALVVIMVIIIATS